MLNFINEMEEIIRVLSGKKRKIFEDESSLRLFQLQLWIHQSFDDAQSLADADVLYAAINVSRKLQLKARKRDQKHARADLILDLTALIKTAEGKRMVGLALGSANSFYGLTQVLSLSDVARLIKGEEKHMQNLVTYVDTVLRLKYGNGVKDPVTRAERMHRFLAVKRAQLDGVDKLHDALYDLEPIKRERKERMCFLYVARRLGLKFLTPSKTPTSVLKQLRKTADHTEVFQRYFAHCAWVQGALQSRTITPGRIERWAGVSALKIDGVEAYPKKLLDSEEVFFTERAPGVKQSRGEV